MQGEAASTLWPPLCEDCAQVLIYSSFKGFSVLLLQRLPALRARTDTIKSTRRAIVPGQEYSTMIEIDTDGD